ATVPSHREDLPRLLAPWQDRLDQLGLSQVNLLAQATSFIDNLADYAVQLAGPVQQLAVASLGALGNLLIVLILSLYMVVDRDAILSFFFRIVPRDEGGGPPPRDQRGPLVRRVPPRPGHPRGGLCRRRGIDERAAA